MNRYRLMVSRNNRLAGHFESATPWALEAVQDIARCLADAGYAIQFQVADGERRLLESGPEGVRVLHSEPIFNDAVLP